MIKYYARQVDWESQDSWLFFHNRKSNKWFFEDDYYTNETIIYGNRDFAEITTTAFDKLVRFDKQDYYDFEGFFNKGYSKCFDTLTQAIEYYFTKENGKRYTTREIHKWKLLLEQYFNNYDLSDDFICKALELITNKKWREIGLNGCCQSDWQYGYVSDKVSDKAVRYLEICYFNTGVEYRVYESKEDFENSENSYSIYVDSFRAEQNLAEALCCDVNEIEIYNFTGYHKVADYERF